jgi:hypothetical protein
VWRRSSVYRAHTSPTHSQSHALSDTSAPTAVSALAERLDHDVQVQRAPFVSGESLDRTLLPSALGQRRVCDAK